MAEAGAQVTLGVERFDLGNGALRARYDALFEECPRAFIQQSTLWAEVIAGLGPDEPVFLLCAEDGRDVAGLPLYVFQGPAGAVVNSVPQAGPLGGVFCRPGLSAASREATYAALLDEARRLAEEHGALSLTLISNPCDPDLELYERLFEPDFVLENFTQWVPVDEVVSGDRLLLRDYTRHSNLRRNLDRARAAGFTPLDRVDAALLEAWHRVHVARHTEIGARPLPFELFENMRRVLAPRDKAWFHFLLLGGEVAGGGVFVKHREVLDLYMPSMNGRYASLGPNFLTVELSLFRAAREGVRVYNWQSSPARGDGVYRFKGQWGSREAPYAFVTKLLADRARLLEIGPEAARSGYPGHYLAPFPGFADGFARRRYTK